MTEQSHVTFPVLPLRDIVVFPHMIVPLFVGRDKSVRALEAVMKDDQQILLTSQKDASDSVKLDEKQSILEIDSVSERLERVYGLMHSEMSVLKVEKKIKTRVKTQMDPCPPKRPLCAITLIG